MSSSLQFLGIQGRLHWMTEYHLSQQSLHMISRRSNGGHELGISHEGHFHQLTHLLRLVDWSLVRSCSVLVLAALIEKSILQISREALLEAGEEVRHLFSDRYPGPACEQVAVSSGMHVFTKWLWTTMNCDKQQNAECGRI